MRVVVDMQGAQRALAASGQLGDFGLRLAQFVVRTGGEHEIVLLLTDLHPETLDPLRELFRGELGADGMRIWSCLPTGDAGAGVSNWRVAAARLIKEAAIRALRPDVLVVPVRWRERGIDLSSLPVFPPSVPGLAVLDRQAVPAVEEGIGKLFGESGLFPEGTPLAGRHACLAMSLADLVRVTAAAGAAPAQPVAAAAAFWDAAHRLVRERLDACVPDAEGGAKPRLAYVSPLPPERSGIADYSAALLPALSRYYDIDVVASQTAVADPWVAEHCSLIAPAAFRQEHASYQRVLYHFGNSKFHDYMFDLLAAVPGVVVLHDFFLGDIQLIREQEGLAAHAWTRALYAGHGYRVLMERFDEAQKWGTLSRYPANLEVLQQAQGLIVHSRHARELADRFYGSRFPAEWAVIPLARLPQPAIGREAARARLGLSPGEFIVCSMGFVNRAKLHDRLLAAWSRSALARDAGCRLLFVGDSDEAFGASVRAAIEAGGLTGRVAITGWVDAASYHDYLAAADLAVQLRAESRGETSAAVLDCMGHCVPTIVNANGSMAELPPDSVYRLADHFTDEELVEALETLWRDAAGRAALGARARGHIDQHHAPEVCALQYAAAIENFAARAPQPLSGVARAIGAAAGTGVADSELAQLALGLARSVPLPTPARQLLVDVTAIAQTDLRTGIQRVVRALVWELIQAPPPGYRIEPVFMSSEGGVWHYRYARGWTSGALGIPCGWAGDEAVDYGAGDVLLIADFTAGFVIEGQRCGMFQALRAAGVKITFTVYDLLPIQLPHMFPPGTAQMHEWWFGAAALVADGALCISQSVALEVQAYAAAVGPQRATPLKVDWFHLGADLEGSVPTGGVPAEAGNVLASLRARPSFLMVGTVEPRKGHAQTLAAFEQLWSHGVDVNLAVVGKRGWMMDALCERLRAHPEAGQRLFWIEGASDEYLQQLYGASLCLIAASEGEGFGLPLIEAAQHGLPIIARDIPVFREVAGDAASYFSGDSAAALADGVQAWLTQRQEGTAPPSGSMHWQTWRESARQVLRTLPLVDQPTVDETAGPPATARRETC